MTCEAAEQRETRAEVPRDGARAVVGAVDAERRPVAVIDRRHVLLNDHLQFQLVRGSHPHLRETRRKEGPWALCPLRGMHEEALNTVLRKAR